MNDSVLPFITVCMPVRNEERFIERTLIELLNQEYPPGRYEIVVADGESTDRTKEIVLKASETNSNIILINNPKKRSSAGRNLCFKRGRGDIFLVVDGHCWIGNDQLFKNIIECFAKSGAQCLGRPQPPDPPDINDFQKAVALARASKIGHGGDSLIYSDFEGYVSPVSHGAIYKREIFEKIGYVDESFDACEDVEFNYRVEKAGFKSYMSPLLTIKYYPRGSLAWLLQQMIRYGRGRLKFLKKHPDTFSFAGMMPVIFVLGLMVWPFIALIGKSWLMAVSVIYGLYLILIISISLLISIRQGISYFPKLIAVYFTIHFGLGWGFLTQIFRPI